jgi:hypothetical protein
MNITIGKANYVITLLVQPNSTRPIVLFLTLICVRIAVDLYHQPTSSAIEIHDESIYRVLSSKLEAAKLSVAQACPKLAFGRRLWLTELARTSENGRVDATSVFGHHSSSPHPNPLPFGEREPLPSPQPSSFGGEGATPFISTFFLWRRGNHSPHPNPLPFGEREPLLSSQSSPRKREGAAPLSLQGRGVGGEG